ncbi:MAG: hypothetical protein ACLRQF_17920 [Thomasclavelia ramosa]
MSRISEAFNNKKLYWIFNCWRSYQKMTVEYILEMEKAGASLIEIGIPFVIRLLKDR